MANYLKISLLLFFINTSFNTFANETNYHLNKKETKQAHIFKKNLAEKNCSSLITLAEADSFLKDYFLIKAAEICPDFDPQLEAFKKIQIETRPWLKSLYLDIKIKKLENRKEPPTEPIELITTYLQKADIETQFKAKENLIKKALELATLNQIIELKQSTETRLHSFSPRLLVNPSSDQFLKVAQNFREWREFPKAIQHFELVIKNKKNSDEELSSAFKGLRQVYKTEQNKKEFIRVTRDWAKWSQKFLKKKNFKLYHEAHMQLARALWTEDQYTEAMKVLTTMESKLKRKYSLAEIYFTMGKMLEEKEKFDQAIETFNKGLIEEKLTLSIYEKTLWNLAWLEYKNSRWLEAAEHLTSLSQNMTEPIDQYKALFWLGKTYGKLNKPEESKTSFEKLILLDPVGYYGMMAHKELNLKFKPIVLNNQHFDYLKDLSILSESDRKDIEALVLLEDKTNLENAMNYFFEKFKTQLNPEQTLSFLQIYAEAGMYLPLFAMVNKLTPELKNQVLTLTPQLLFPLPFKELTLEAEKTTKTKAEFLNAIIRQESAFNPRARSSVDALGLTQLMPKVAKQTAKAHNVTFKSDDDLYDPALSILLGAWELQDLLQRNKMNYILSIASYNASGSAVKNWYKTRFKADPLEFIEEVPYEETRGYLKLVLRNTVFYKRLLADKEFEFPLEYLIWPDASK